MAARMLITRLIKQMLTPDSRRGVDDRQQPVDGGAHAGSGGYAFTSDWFSPCIPLWQDLFARLPGAARILEVGSYEGQSAAWLIENAFVPGAKGEIYCVDTWAGGVEHQAVDMAAVEARFLRNVATAKSRSRSDVAVHVRKGQSSGALAALLGEGLGQSFDAIHVDGSHQCADVLGDLVLSFQLCRVGGLIICDDYGWSQEAHGAEDLLNQPKLAIDSFVNCYRRKIEIIAVNLRQAYLGKTSA